MENQIKEVLQNEKEISIDHKYMKYLKNNFPVDLYKDDYDLNTAVDILIEYIGAYPQMLIMEQIRIFKNMKCILSIYGKV